MIEEKGEWPVDVECLVVSAECFQIILRRWRRADYLITSIETGTIFIYYKWNLVYKRNFVVNKLRPRGNMFQQFPVVLSNEMLEYFQRFVFVR